MVLVLGSYLYQFFTIATQTEGCIDTVLPIAAAGFSSELKDSAKDPAIVQS